jgi:hypothetical protein
VPQQDEGLLQPRKRLVFSREVNEGIKSRLESALRERPNNEEAAIDHVLEWLCVNRKEGQQPEVRAFRPLLDHFIKSAIAQAWIDRIEGTLTLEGGGESDQRREI